MSPRPVRVEPERLEGDALRAYWSRRLSAVRKWYLCRDAEEFRNDEDLREFWRVLGAAHRSLMVSTSDFDVDDLSAVVDRAEQLGFPGMNGENDE